MDVVDGWRADPFGAHEERLFREGRPTPLVRDAGIGSYHDPHGAESMAVGASSRVGSGTERITTTAINLTDVPPTEPTPVVGPPTRAIPLSPRRSRPKPSRRTSPPSRSGFLIVVVTIVGLLATAVAVAYATIPADSLPSFLGRRAGMTGYRTGRAEEAAAIAIVLLVIAIIITIRTRFPKLVASTWRRLLGR